MLKMARSLSRAGRLPMTSRPLLPMASLARAVTYGKPTAKKFEHPILVAQDGPIADVNLTEKMMWDNPNRLLPERQDLIWDDGTAKPEWYIDRECWSVSTPQAVAQLFGALFGIFGGLALFLSYNYDKIGYKSPVIRREVPFEGEDYVPVITTNHFTGRGN